MTAAADTSISYNLIFKGECEPLLACLRSVYKHIYREGDECVIVDTGCTRPQFKRLKKALESDEFPGEIQLIRRPDLSTDYAPYISELLGEEILSEYRKYHKGNTTGLMSFAAAREVARLASKNGIIFWIDSDDVLYDEGGNLRDTVDAFFREGHGDGIFLDYLYAFAPDGTCTTTQRRERFMRRDKFVWKGHCHETLIPVDPATTGSMGLLDGVKAGIRHTDARKPHRISDVRNLIILLNALENEEQDGYVDPRTLFYVGNSWRGLERFEESRNYYERFDRVSGSVDDRFAAKYYTANMFLHPKIKRPLDAYDKFMECIAVKPYDPRGYFGLQNACMVLERHEEALHWYKTGLKMQMPEKQVMSWDPTSVFYRPHLAAANSAKELGLKTDAVEFAKRAFQYRPNSEEARSAVMYYEMWSAGVHMHESVSFLAQHVEPHLRKQYIRKVVSDLPMVPEELERVGVGKLEPVEMRKKKPSLAIWCGPTGEPWGSFSRYAGTGGSEKMVIMLAEAIQATGRANVTVYCATPPEYRGIDERTQVCWRHFSEFDESRKRDVVVVWRAIEAVAALQCPAKKRALWLHDVQDPARYTPEVLAATDLVNLQSKAHAAPVADILGAKAWVARNAIEEPREREVERNTKQVLYCSSPDRGLLTAAKIVKRAQAIDPEISLVVTYGITPWARKSYSQNQHRFIPDVGHDTSTDIYEREFFAALDEVGAGVLHRVGFEQMEILMQNSGVWLYPTRFHEISCMAAMEAQANGLIPVATRFHALKETLSKDIPDDLVLPPLPSAGEPSEEWLQDAAERLVRACNMPADDDLRIKLAAEARERFLVGPLVTEWLSKLGFPEVDSAADRRVPACVRAKYRSRK